MLNFACLLLAQCITQPVLAKETIAEQPALKVGYNTTNSQWTNDEYYWIVPAREPGYWWLLSQIEYVIDRNNVELGSSTFSEHTPNVNYLSLVVPTNCPSMGDCPSPRR